MHTRMRPLLSSKGSLDSLLNSVWYFHQQPRFLVHDIIANIGNDNSSSKAGYIRCNTRCPPEQRVELIRQEKIYRYENTTRLRMMDTEVAMTSLKWISLSSLLMVSLGHMDTDHHMCIPSFLYCSQQHTDFSAAGNCSKYYSASSSPTMLTFSKCFRPLNCSSRKIQ